MSSLFLSDVDGTLMNADLTIDEKNIEKIKEWKAQGKYFGLVTGRDRIFCQKLLDKYGIEADCLITCNGAMTFWRDELVDTSLIDLDISIDIFKRLKMYSDDLVSFFTAEDGTHYFNIDQVQKQWVSIKERLAYLGVLREEDVLSYLSGRTQGCAKISLFTYTKENRDRYLPILQQTFPNVEVMPTSVDYIEITQRGTDKSRALLKLMDCRQLTLDEIAFIGDGANDVPLFDLLKHTYVMETAEEHIKERASICVDSVEKAIDIERNQE